jgi:tRNA(Ile)-lysidine synthase
MLNKSLLPEGKILVAVSGGADSLALLRLLHDAKWPLVAAHVNHGLRGGESDEDEAFVLQLCAAHGIEFDSRRVICEPSEDAARQARYAALEEMALSHGCSAIATGHTADDVLETILINWLRGAAVAGLAGIPPQRKLDSGLLLVRPLLEATREETRALCREIGWAWREDSSNESDIYTRNRVRQLLTSLGEAGGVSASQLARQTARAAHLWREESEFLDELAHQQLEMLSLQRTEELLVLNGVRFRQLLPALARRVLRLAAQSLEPLAREVGSEPIETVRRHIAASGRHAVWQWKSNISVEWTGAASGNRIRFRVVRGVAGNQ